MRIKGLAEVNKRLQRLPLNVVDEVSRQIEKEAEKLVQEMRLLVPVEFGFLRASIGWTWGDTPPGSFTLGSFRGNANARLRAIVFAGDKTTKDGVFDVARLQEFGTVNMAANPYFFPAYRSNKRRISGNLSRAVTRGAKKS